MADDEFIPFKQRPEWSDVTPIPQDDGPAPIVAIAYTAQFRETMDYFRAILQRDEKSERALALTAEVIDTNAANYTCWYFRRRCLEALGKDLVAELAYVSKIAEESPKNYQLWHHREACVDRLGDGSRELDFTAQVLLEDAKNYHAWAHRQWAIKRFNMWDNELAYVEQLIGYDVRNNSAWNQRFFVVTRAGANQPLPAATVRQEVDFALEKIRRAPNNEAAWNYLKGIIRGHLAEHPEVHTQVVEIKNSFPACAPARSLLVDILEHNKDTAQDAVALCNELANDIDQIRAKYWNYRRDLILARA